MPIPLDGRTALVTGATQLKLPSSFALGAVLIGAAVHIVAM